MAVMMMMEAVSAEQKGEGEEATLQSVLTIPFWRGGFPGSRLRPGGGFHLTRLSAELNVEKQSPFEAATRCFIKRLAHFERFESFLANSWPERILPRSCPLPLSSPTASQRKSPFFPLRRLCVFGRRKEEEEEGPKYQNHPGVKNLIKIRE